MSKCSLLVDMPEELREHTFVLFRVGLRRRLATFRLRLFRMRQLREEIALIFAFCNDDAKVVLRLITQR